MAQPPGFVNPAFPSHVCKLNKAIYGSSPIYILVYVDDIISTGPSTSLVTQFINLLSIQFSLKDLGSLSYFLRIECIPHSQGLLLSQQKYITDILKKAKMSDCRPISTSITCSETLTLTGAPVYPSPTDYRAIVGALEYLSLTRPDVAFAVNKLSQFMHAPTFQHWSALKCLLRYLQGTISKGLLLRKGSALN
uniref:uncharacterized mitochondrial protein AtMg00810-like n=1 Tax=Erigeron canadensis TaxID=72917 RepID=UPI001CB8F327|nr:uncharacterized mitochondrial protein AtMg00810-like [Erigeron canadensis]